MEMKQILFEGVPRASEIDTLSLTLSFDTVYTFDFEKVQDINFGAVRAFIHLKEAGYHFHIIHADDKVASFFDRTGASAFISVCRKAIPFNLAGNKMSGESFTAKTYFTGDDVMAKVYSDFISEETVTHDLITSRSVMVSGINTPMASDLIKVGDNQYGVLFERVQNKRSFARALSQEPEAIDDYARRFVKMTKQLHATHCDTSVFMDHAPLLKNAVEHSMQYTEAERRKMLDFINSVPEAKTCIHGDLHIGNVITDGKCDLWIDMGDFAYGNPLWDISMFYFVSCLNPSEEMVKDMFHVDIPMMRRFWKLFATYYFDADTDVKQEAVHRLIRPYAAIRMVYLVNHFNRDLPFMTPTVREILPTM